MKNLVYVDDESAYSITHTIFYLSDFGTKSLPLDSLEVMRIQNVIESLMIHYGRIGHWDLLGELLLCIFIIGPPQRSLWQKALEAFIAIQKVDGAIPGRIDTEDEFASATIVGDEQRLFSGCYHTTIVGLILSAQIINKLS